MRRQPPPPSRPAPPAPPTNFSDKHAGSHLSHGTSPQPTAGPRREPSAVDSASRLATRPPPRLVDGPQGDSSVETTWQEKARIRDELVALKAELASSRNPHGRKATKEERLKLRTLYSRYLELKSPTSNGRPTCLTGAPSPASTVQVAQEQAALLREKHALQRRLHRFRTEFERANRRPIRSKSDRRPVEADYLRYQ
ncbi:hypothetical protein HK405_011717, partial [Cladochytrium tenue]